MTVGLQKTRDMPWLTSSYLTHLSLYVLTTLQCCLLYLTEAAVKLQGPSQEVTSGFAVIEKCSSQYLYTLLKPFATLPLSLWSCECSAPALRRLNTYDAHRRRRD